MDKISEACQQLERHDASLTLLNLSCSGVGSEGLKKLSKSCGCSCCDSNSDQGKVCQSPSTSSSLVALWLENNEIYPTVRESAYMQRQSEIGGGGGGGSISLSLDADAIYPIGSDSMRARPSAARRNTKPSPCKPIPESQEASIEVAPEDA